MRILPLCIYLSKREDIEENKRLEMIHLASGLTHNHEISKISCGIYYFIVDEIIHKKKLSKTNILINAMNRANHYYESYELYNRFIRLKEVMNFMKLTKEEIYSSGYVLHSLEASIWCFLNTSSYKECVLKAVNLGEDTDTTGAIVGGLAGLYYGYEDIPSSWINRLIRKEWIDQLCSQANLL